MGLVWDHLEETKTVPAQRGKVQQKKKGFYIANELAHRHVKRWVFRKSGCPSSPSWWTVKCGGLVTAHTVNCGHANSPDTLGLSLWRKVQRNRVITGRILCDKSIEEEEALFFLRKLRKKWLLPFIEIKILAQPGELGELGHLQEGPSASRVASHEAHSITWEGLSHEPLIETRSCEMSIIGDRNTETSLL